MSSCRALGILLLIAAPAGAATHGPAAVEAIPAAAPSPWPVEFSQPAAGSSLHEGEIVEIRWSGVRVDADEIELLLSVDGGRHFSLRLTKELDSDSRSFLWRVPSLVTDNATLAIRMGVNGREITSAPGPLFRLSRNPSAAGVPLRWEAGEIWVDSHDRDDESGRSSVPHSGLSADGERIASAPSESGTLDLPRFSNARPSAAAREMPDRARRDADGRIRTGSPSRVPLSIPQRI